MIPLNFIIKMNVLLVVHLDIMEMPIKSVNNVNNYAQVVLVLLIVQLAKLMYIYMKIHAYHNVL